MQMTEQATKQYAIKQDQCTKINRYTGKKQQNTVYEFTLLSFTWKQWDTKHLMPSIIYE